LFVAQLCSHQFQKSKFLKYTYILHENVSDVGEVGHDVVPKEASNCSSDSPHVSASVVNETDVNQTTRNSNKESVMEEEAEAAVKDAKSSRISPVKHDAKVKSDGSKQSEM